MKKYFLTVSVMALFAIGFAASDEDESSNSGSSVTQTEQKQETEAERQARERKEEAERKAREQKAKEERAEAKKKKVAEAGYERGREKAFEGGPLLPDAVNICYSNRFGTPSNSEEMELFKIYKQNFEKGYEEGLNAR